MNVQAFGHSLADFARFNSEDLSRCLARSELARSLRDGSVWGKKSVTNRKENLTGLFIILNHG